MWVHIISIDIMSGTFNVIVTITGHWEVDWAFVVKDVWNVVFISNYKGRLLSRMRAFEVVAWRLTCELAFDRYDLKTLITHTKDKARGRE